MRKQCFLIIAHHHFQQLSFLLKCLDNSQSDIYLLVDSKAMLLTDIKNLLKNSVKKSKLVFTQRIPIYWGDYSQIDAEMILFKEAFRNSNYSYYHLISGDTLPLVASSNIINYFNRHQNKVFISYAKFEKPNIVPNAIKNRVQYYHISPKLTGKNNLGEYVRKMFRLMDRVYIYLQKLFRINLVTKYDLSLDYASNWLSLDSATTKILLDNSDWIEKVFKHSIACDELFIPVFINKFSLANKVYNNTRLDDKAETIQGSLQYVNFWDGSPYVWQDKDVDFIKSLANKGYLFSRKFDIQKSPLLYQFIREQCMR